MMCSKMHLFWTDKKYANREKRWPVWNWQSSWDWEREWEWYGEMIQKWKEELVINKKCGYWPWKHDRVNEMKKRCTGLIELVRAGNTYSVSRNAQNIILLELSPSFYNIISRTWMELIDIQRHMTWILKNEWSLPGLYSMRTWFSLLNTVFCAEPCSKSSWWRNGINNSSDHISWGQTKNDGNHESLKVYVLQKLLK